MKKIYAFTILELIVVMVIGAIIISLTMKSMDEIQQTWLAFYKKQTTYMSSLQFSSVFERDWDSALWAVQNSSVIVLSSPSDTITYQVLPGKIVRVSRQAVDSFNFGIKNILLKTAGNIPTEVAISISDQGNPDITWLLKKAVTSRDICFNLADGD